MTFIATEFPNLAFVNIETTRCNSVRYLITEIGIKTLVTLDNAFLDFVADSPFR